VNTCKGFRGPTRTEEHGSGMGSSGGRRMTPASSKSAQVLLDAVWLQLQQ
jgi:hypothetical protein